MLTEQYNTIESVYQHFKLFQRCCLTDEEMKKTGIELIIDKENLPRAVSERMLLELSHPQYYIVAQIDSYLPQQKPEMVVTIKYMGGKNNDTWKESTV